MECDVASLPPFTDTLEKLGRDEGFVVHNVCSVQWQLQSTGVCNVNSSVLRESLGN